MVSGTALWKGDTWSTGWGDLSLTTEGVLALSTSEATKEVSLQLGSSAFVDTCATDRWLCAVGASSPEVVIGHRDGPLLDVVAVIPRLQRDGCTGFDRHAVRFHPRADRDQCLLAWEAGVALVDPADGLVWSFVHDDIDQRVRSVTQHSVELVGVRAAFTLSLEDGAATAREQRSTRDVDLETLAQWRREIGR